MQTILSIVGVCAALVMCAVSGAMNYLFLSSLGKTVLEGHFLGAASAAADLLKALLPFFIAWSWRSRQFVAAISGGIAFLFFACFSFLSAIGFTADNRGVLVETRDALAAAYNRVQRELGDAEMKRATLAAHRPASVVFEAVERHKQDRRWSATRSCQNATEPESRLYCDRYFALRAELAAGQEEAAFAEAIAALQAQATKLRDEGAGLDRDPQVALLSRIVGQEQDKVRLALIVIVALLVELGSSLGLFLATKHREGEVRKEETSNPTTSSPTLALEPGPLGSVEDFCLEALAASENGAISMERLLTAYRAWCAAHGFSSMADTEFSETFEALATTIGLNQEVNTFAGIIATFGTERQLAA